MERGIATGVRAEQVAALDSWEQLYNAYQPGIMRYLLGMCCEPALADELTQEVFVRAATHALLFRGESSLSTWLFRIARNTYLSWVERQHDVQVTTSQFLAFPDERRDGNPEAQVLLNEQRARVHQAIAMLPERQRTMLLLRDLQALSYAEIALVLDMSLAAVKVNLHRARLRFRDVYAMIEGTDDD
ncbi:MAG: sigma-70 family RNA polymerase sigma factor [Herpetosiphonaceae bacterium]|nr:sigma-70 family RNA polymerase sigma factor [Herpetosiphonaceae bacterium]